LNGNTKDTLILGGDVRAQFTYTKPEELDAAAEKCRLEQEAICGYELISGELRSNHMVDAQGRDVYEVFVTYSPRRVTSP
jgi:hypothetical protein